MEENRRTLRYWSFKEDDLLLSIVHRLGGSSVGMEHRNWYQVAARMNEEAPALDIEARLYTVVNTRLRYQKVMDTTFELSAGDIETHSEAGNTTADPKQLGKVTSAKVSKLVDDIGAGESSLAQVWKQVEGDLETKGARNDDLKVLSGRND